MHPTLLQIGDFSLSSYYTMITLGFLALLIVGRREAIRVGVDTDDFLDMSLYMLFVGLIGSRLLHVFADGYFWDYVHLCTDPLQVDVPSFIHVKCDSDAACLAADAGALCDPEAGRCHPARDCLAALKFWHGGLAFLGGFVAAAAVALWLIRRRKLDLEKIYGLGAICVPLALAIGRVGCLLSGCCFGAVTTGPLGVQFDGYVKAAGPDVTCPKNYDLITTDDGSQVCAFGRPAFLEHVKHDQLELGARESLPVHPTQAYEAAFVFAIWLYLYFWRRKRSRFASQGFWELCILYGVGRFVVEFFRADDRGIWLGNLSTSQLISVPMIAFGVWRLYKGFKSLKNPPDLPKASGPPAETPLAGHPVEGA